MQSQRARLNHSSCLHVTWPGAHKPSTDAEGPGIGSQQGQGALGWQPHVRSVPCT